MIETDISSLTRLASGVLQGVAVLLLGWIGITTQQTALAVARLEERVNNVTEVNSDRIRSNADRMNQFDQRVRDVEALIRRYHPQ